MEPHSLSYIARQQGNLSLLTEWAERKGINPKLLNLTLNDLHGFTVKTRTEDDHRNLIAGLLAEETMPSFSGNHNSYLD